MTSNEVKVPIDRLRSLLAYDPDTGDLRWRVRIGCAVAGALAGVVKANGYRCLKVDRIDLRGHRVAWALHFGYWPDRCIDHINGNRADNRIVNLRDVTQAINAQNQRAGLCSGSTGLLGAHRHHNKFKASIHANGRLTYLGVFATAEEAHAAYMAAKRIYHPGAQP